MGSGATSLGALQRLLCSLARWRLSNCEFALTGGLAGLLARRQPRTRSGRRRPAGPVATAPAAATALGAAPATASAAAASATAFSRRPRGAAVAAQQHTAAAAAGTDSKESGNGIGLVFEAGWVGLGCGTGRKTVVARSADGSSAAGVLSSGEGSCCSEVA